MNSSSYYNFTKYAVFAIVFTLFTALTYFIFNSFFLVQPSPFIDEIFHIPQAQKYCTGIFNEWDPKITTLPGVYLISIGALKPLSFFMNNVCSVYALRLTNLVACIVNFYLLYYLTRTIHHSEVVKNDWKAIFSGLNLALFPPLYFFTFLYYTDTISTSLVLLTITLHLLRQYNLASVTGFISICTRQTNVMWVALVALDGVVQYLNSQINVKGKKITQKMQSSSNYFKILMLSVCDIKDKQSLLRGLLRLVGGYIVVGATFCTFVILNCGIVVGDKQAHIPTLHLTQMCYFSVFFVIFASPFCIGNISAFLKFVKRQWKLVGVAAILLYATVYLNTLVHPYLLADNRHYTFYVWKRVYENHLQFRYLLIPVYIFGFYCIHLNISHFNVINSVGFYLCLSLCLIPQRLLEFRYFIIPYIFLRMHVKDVCWWQLISEFLLYSVVNFATVYIFFTKTFYWSDSEELQRIIW